MRSCFRILNVPASTISSKISSISSTLCIDTKGRARSVPTSISKITMPIAHMSIAYTWDPLFLNSLILAGQYGSCKWWRSSVFFSDIAIELRPKSYNESISSERAIDRGSISLKINLSRWISYRPIRRFFTIFCPNNFILGRSLITSRNLRGYTCISR